MAYQNLRSTLDGLSEERLLQLRDEVEDSPDGSTHEIEGVQVPKETLLQLINQSLPIAGS